MNQTIDNDDQNVEQQCPVCCSPIEPNSDTVTCPNCKMVYHKECWDDNNGCATYGCSSAGCLKPPPMKIDLADTSFNSGARGSSGANQCPYCKTPLESGATFCWSCGKEVSGIIGGVDANTPKARPSYRWSARIFDLTLESLIVSVPVLLTLLALIGEKNYNEIPDAFFNVIILPFSILLDSLCYTIFRGTLGKWLFGVKVVNEDFTKISAGGYFHRNWRVYWGGLAMGIFPIPLFTQICQYRRVSKGLQATYDEDLHMESVEYKKHPLKTFLGIVLFLFMLMIIGALSAAGKQ